MPLKVLMFGWELPPFNSGGLGVACYGLTKALSQQDVDITFVLPQKQNVEADFMRLVFADLPKFAWPSVSSAFSPYSTQYLTPRQIKLAPGTSPSDLVDAVQRYAAAAADLAKKLDYDVIHAHDWLCFPAGVAAAAVSHKPLVTHVHATEFDRSGGASVNSLVYGLERQGLSSSTAVIAVSNFTKNLLTKFYSTPGSKISVVHNGINANDFTSPGTIDDSLRPLKEAGFKVVSYIGRITLQKGPDYFLKTAKLVLRYNPKVVFMIVGSGDMEKQVIEEAVHLGISDHILFAGFLRGEQLRQAYRSSDLFIMPSVSEPFGITALESVAAGTPAIISKQSGVSEALTHVLKADFWDVEEMANQVLSVVSHPSLHKLLRQNGSAEVKKVSWQSAAAKTIGVYQKVLGGSK